MTEPRQSLPINIFNPSSGSFSSGSSPNGGLHGLDAGNKSFLRELSRAADQVTSKSETRSHSKKSGSEAAAKPEPGRSSGHDQRSSRPDVENSQTSSSSSPDRGSHVSDRASQTESDPSVRNSQDANPSKSKQDTDPVEEVTHAKPATREGGVNVSALIDKDGSEAASAIDVEALLVDATSVGETNIESLTVDSDIPLSPLLNDAPALVEDNEGALVDEAVTAIASVGTSALAVGDAKSARDESSNRDHLSPVRLATGQAQLTGKTALPGHAVTALSAAQSRDVPVDAELAEKTAERTGVVIMPGQSAVNNRQRRNTLIGFEGTPASMNVFGTNKTTNSVNIEESGGESLSNLLSSNQPAKETATLRLQQAEVNAAVDLSAKQATKKVEEQMVQANLLQTKQLNLQQLQSPLAGIQPAGSESGSAGTLSADNTFHSMPGGIVTAPVQQRVDAGSMQTINAPLNMSILQNDADKAMAGNIRWMVGEGIKSAVVNVTPSGMGPISVTVGLERDQMNVSIVALQGSTREALDSMLPRLREQLAAQGHDSVKVDISDGRGDQPPRGYGQQFSGEQREPENNAHWSVSNVESETDASDGESGNGNPLQNSQGAKSVNLNVFSGSRYDVYV